jgi:hypothetical protein
VLDCKATDKFDSNEIPRFGKWGKQTCKDTGPLARIRMETVEEEFVDRAVDFLKRSVKAGKPFFLWFNPTRMHVWTHLSPKWADKSGYGIFADGMMELDWEVGELLKQLDDLGIADNTIVILRLKGTVVPNRHLDIPVRKSFRSTTTVAGHVRRIFHGLRCHQLRGRLDS